MKNTKPKIIMLIIYTVIVALAIFAGLKSSDVSVLNSENSFFIDKESFEPSFNVRKITKSEQGLQEYSIYLSGEGLSHLNSDTLIFFMNKITDSAYSIKFNDVIIGEEGDMEKGNSMMKNSAHHFSFDRKLIEEDNLLVINTYATYKSGSESEGIYIVESNTGMRLSQNTDYLSNNLLVSGIVFLIFTAFLMVIIYFFNKNQESGFLYCALALVFISIYFIDYLKFVYLKNNYLTYKKVFLTSLHIGVWFTLVSISKFLKIKQIKYLSALSAVAFLVMSLMVDNFVVYKKIYSSWYIVLVINFVMAVIYSIRNLKKSRHAFIFVIAFFYLVTYASLILAIEHFTSSLRLNSPLVYIVIFAVIPVLFTFEELTNKEKQISYEKEQKEKEHIKSLTDDLTGVWNQRFLYSKLEEKMIESTIAMIDIDDFKLMNDTYSHLAGDFVLKEFAKLVMASIRKSDDICRYGGDEFIIMFYDCSIKEAAAIMEILCKKIKNHKFIYESEALSITVSMGLYKINEEDTVKTALSKVDKKLYEAKGKGKNCISYY